jgi:galactokinase
MDTKKFPLPVQSALERFPIAFSDAKSQNGPIAVAWAPGRVNLIGEHTDYNEGFVLPIAVDRVAAFAGRRRADNVVRLASIHFNEDAHFSLENLSTAFEELRKTLPNWARYIMGVLTELQRAGVELDGFDAVVGGDVPLGGGMSSSAALEVATVHLCSQLLEGSITIGTQGATLTPIEVAALCQRAENNATGLKSGILDQAASCLGRPRQATFLDCRTLDYRYLPFDAPQFSLVVIDTGVRRELASSKYNERRQQCEEATGLLRDLITQYEPGNTRAQEIKALRDITQEQFDRYKHDLPEVLRKRAGYVIAEDARVLQVVKLLEEGNFEAVGPILWEGHGGLRYEYEVSCDELDALVEIAQQVPGVLGGRMVGGGFGGCTVNLVRNEAVAALKQAVEQHYPERIGQEASVYISKAAGGPGQSWAE